jgi:prepilin-type N-terminal cleavage/methylation domain-containing protein
MKRGLTLLEMVIAMLIFGVFVVMSTNSLMGIQGMVRGVESNDIIEDHMQVVDHVMGRDLNNTGWFRFGQQFSQNPQPLYPQVHYAVTRDAQQPGVRTVGLVDATGALLSSPQPRPLVNAVPFFAGSFAGGVVPIPSPKQEGHVISTPPLSWAKDFGINADVLYFIRIRANSDIVPVSAASSAVNNVSFRSAPTPLSAIASAPFIENVVFNPGKFTDPNLLFQPATSVVWESGVGGLSWAQNADPLNLRICRYYLEPDRNSYDRKMGFCLTGILKVSYADAVALSPSFGLPMATNNNLWPWGGDREICRDVESLVFDTSFTDPMLSGDQVRVKIGFLRRHELTGALIRRTYERIFVMRSIP